MQRIIDLLTLITLSIWIAVFSIDNNLRIIACDVGQGDAILVQKNTTQILIDAGPNSRVLDCLGKYMPFWDKEIELAISTHIDKDHSGGFSDVYRSYKIKNFLVNSNQTDGVLQKGQENVIFPEEGVVIGIGKIYLDILWPEATIKNLKFEIKNSETNDTSIVVLLKYDQFRGLFMGDLELNKSEDLFEKTKIGSVDYIKISHHGSKNGTSQKLLDLLHPKTAVISVGKNSYGHPDPKILEMLINKSTKILRTDLEGDIDLTF